jgi:hypothetical protein
VVRNAVQTLSGRGRQALVIATLCWALALFVGCGGSDRSGARASSDGGRGVGESLRLATCTDWNRATEAQRHNTILDLREFSGGAVGSSAGIRRGPVLDDNRAYKLFRSYCAKYLARGFKLYKLYSRAAAMVGAVQP